MPTLALCLVLGCGGRSRRPVDAALAPPPEVQQPLEALPAEARVFVYVDFAKLAASEDFNALRELLVGQLQARMKHVAKAVEKLDAAYVVLLPGTWRANTPAAEGTPAADAGTTRSEAPAQDTALSLLQGALSEADLRAVLDAEDTGDPEAVAEAHAGWPGLRRGERRALRLASRMWLMADFQGLDSWAKILAGSPRRGCLSCAGAQSPMTQALARYPIDGAVAHAVLTEEALSESSELAQQLGPAAAFIRGLELATLRIAEGKDGSELIATLVARSEARAEQLEDLIRKLVDEIESNPMARALGLSSWLEQLRVAREGAALRLSLTVSGEDLERLYRQLLARRGIAHAKGTRPS